MAIKKQVISISDARSATAGPPLSAAIKAGDFIFVSGQPPRDFKTGELVFGDIHHRGQCCVINRGGGGL